VHQFDAHWAKKLFMKNRQIIALFHCSWPVRKIEKILAFIARPRLGTDGRGASTVPTFTNSRGKRLSFIIGVEPAHRVRKTSIRCAPNRINRLKNRLAPIERVGCPQGNSMFVGAKKLFTKNRQIIVLFHC
jgi:hypothetical protein